MGENIKIGIMKDVRTNPPQEGIEVICFNENWICKDFNPHGTRIGFLNGENDWITAYWSNYKDCYYTRLSTKDDINFSDFIGVNQIPTHWCEIPKFETIKS